VKKHRSISHHTAWNDRH